MPLLQPPDSGAGVHSSNEEEAVTSEERRKARYERRVQQRAEKKKRRQKWADDFKRVFSYGGLYYAYKCCRCGVSWKASVQRYIALAPLQVYRTWKRLQEGKFRSPGFFEFILRERGKIRYIRSTVIGERVVQRCLCDRALVPMLQRSFIYDNGASMVNKGYDFAMRRLERHLHEHYRKHGQEGYVLLFDFSKFFDNVSHQVLEEILRGAFTDERIIGITMHFVKMFGEKGLGLGSQISQVLALASANRLDHLIKEKLRIHGYGRYMDDGYLIHRSKAYLQKCLQEIRKMCETLGIVLNEKKTQIVKLSHGFTWLKARFLLTESGRVVRRIYKRSVTVMRRKLKTFRRKLDEGQMRFQDVETAWRSWRGYAEKFDAWHTRQRLGSLYDQLFITDWRNERCIAS